MKKLGVLIVICLIIGTALWRINRGAAVTYSLILPHEMTKIELNEYADTLKGIFDDLVYDTDFELSEEDAKILIESDADIIKSYGIFIGDEVVVLDKFEGRTGVLTEHNSDVIRDIINEKKKN